MFEILSLVEQKPSSIRLESFWV